MSSFLGLTDAVVSDWNKRAGDQTIGGKKEKKKYWYTKHIAVDANEIVTLRAEWFVLENILLWRTWYIRSGNLIYARIRIARAKVEW